MDELSEIGFVGIDGFYNTFLSIVAASTEGSSNSVSNNQSEETADDISGQEWYETDAADDYDFTTISDANELKIENSGEDNTYILSLPEDEWPSITEIRSYRIYDDGDKFVYLGEEQKYHRTSDGNVEMNFEKSWKSVDGSLVTYYANEPEINEDVTVFSGRIPARLNDEDNISIIVEETMYSDGESTSKILGYYPDDSDNVIPNGYFRLKKGDVVQFTSSCTDYGDDNFTDCDLGEPITITSQDDLEIGTYDLSDSRVYSYVKLIDVFQQKWSTDMIKVN